MMLLTVNSAEGNDVDRNYWYVDNGATNHVTMREDLFEDFEYFSDNHTVTTADRNTIKAVGKGSIRLEAVVNGRTVNSTLRDVWYVPQISRNLFSVLSTQDRNPESVFESRVTTCIMKIGGKVTVTGNRERYGGLYKLNCKVLPPVNMYVNLVQKVDMLQLYHERFGHQNKRHIKNLIDSELGIKMKDSEELCEGCIFGKTHRQKFGVRDKATKPGERIHSDVCGPFPSSFSKLRYFVLFKDEYTRHRFVYFLRNKSEVHEKLEQFLAEAKVAGHIIKELLSDNGGEFDNAKVRKILLDCGIKQRLTMPYTPEQNGCSERENRTIVECARAMMHAHEELPQKLWAVLVNTAVYILNRTGPTSVDYKSPSELWSGYDNDDGYRLWNERAGLIRSRDVIFDDVSLLRNGSLKVSKPLKTELSSNFELFEHPLIVRQNMQNRCAEILPPVETAGAQNIEIDDEGLPEDLLGNNNELLAREDTPVVNEDIFDDARSYTSEQIIECGEDIEEVSDEHHDDINECEIVHDGLRVLRDRSMLRPPHKFNDFVLYNLNTEWNSNRIEPSCYKEAIRSSDGELWRHAMDSEIHSLKENKTWILVDLPKGRKAIPCKWVYKVKLNVDGSVEKYKARLVIKGYTQKKGVDYDQTFSPVARMATIRSVLAVAANEQMPMMQFDVSTAFLYGNLNEEIYMRQPEGYEDESGRVCLLQKSLYGLKQAPRCWNKHILDYFKEIGLKVADADPCLFTKNTSSGKLIVTLYVDDGLVAASNKTLIDNFLKDLKTKFSITTKPVSYFLGIEIKVREDGIKIHQKSYVNKILRRFGMESCRPVITPIVKDMSQNKDRVDMENMLKNYRHIVGALAYLMVATRPDIAYAVSVASRSLEKPTGDDCVKLKRILRYLQYTPDMGILYKKNYKKGVIECYSDADHGGDIDTGRSTTGLILCMYAGGAVSWMSQRQTSVAISTTEAEVVAASEAARECIWLCRVLSQLTVLEYPPILQVDNEAAVRLAENPEFHKRTKHIRIRHFFVRELVTNGELQIARVCSEMQLADIFTKALPRPRLEKITVIVVVTEIICLLKNGIILLGNTLWLILTFIPVHLPQLLRAGFKSVNDYIVDIIVDAYMSLLNITNFLTDVPLESFIGIISAIIIVRLSIHFRETIQTLTTEFYWCFVRKLMYFYYTLYNYFTDSEVRVITHMASGQNITSREVDFSDNDVDDSNNPADALCVICQERQKCVLTLPCRHVCLCTECCRRLYGYQRTCPICRTFIYHSVTVYL
ncbi:uncharacterized protein ACR2FA_001787 [Aphomia sociella]